MSAKQKYPYALAAGVANEIQSALAPFCEPGRCMVAGSMRRKKDEVGDIEILFVPLVRNEPIPGLMFAGPVNQAAKAIEDMIILKAIAPRENKRNQRTWGELIKLARHTASGVPVDFFTATMENWWNYLVCRTGPAESNMAIAKAAQARGLKWKPYSAGFCGADDPDETICIFINGEAGVFETVGLNYLTPDKR
jgi:DNA polymerase/3'-5' exonuclease PolX